MRQIAIPMFAWILAAAAGAVAEEPKPAPEAAPAAAAAPAKPSNPAAAGMSDHDKAAYALGFALWRNLQTFDLSPEEVEIVKRALTDAARGAEPVVTLEEARPLLDAMRKERMEKRLAATKQAGAAFAAAAAAEPGAETSASGMIYFETAAGSGASPAATDSVKVHYRGTLVDGTEFDSSRKRDKPAEFALNRVIKCWTEGLQKMKVGGKAKLVCPSEIAYGDRGRPSIPAGSTLVFEVELLEIVAKEAPKPAAETPEPEGE
jgi:FKBP-type peptidyl-prolyl cis-trans isomerase FkpA